MAGGKRGEFILEARFVALGGLTLGTCEVP